MSYRITIEKEKPKDERGCIDWEEVYQQVIADLNVRTLVSHINNTRTRKAKEFTHANLA